MSKQVKTFCRICEPACPLIAKVSSEGEIALEPDLDHPIGGVACHKGLSYTDIHTDPDRLNEPLQRQNPRSEQEGIFEPVSWEDATNDIAKRLNQLIEEHGANSVGIFSGNPGVFNSRGMIYGGAFGQMLGTQMRFSANTQDMSNRMVSAAALYGTNAVMIPDLPNTEYLLCMGSNPRVSKWTVLVSKNDSGKTMENIAKRGAKILFVNPRLTESSTPETGETLLIKPGADVYFLAALMDEIQKLGGVDEAIVDKYGSGLQQALDFVSKYPAERVSDVTGLAASEIKQVAKDFIAANGAGIYVSVGVNQGRQGTLAAWLADLIVFATGNLGKKGGMYKPTGIADMFPPVPVDKIKVKTSLGEMSYTMPGTVPLPAAALADLIESGDIKALICTSGNPILSVGGENGLRKAFQKLELMVSVDILPNATAYMSDYVLPATDFLERADINFIANGLQLQPYVQYTDEVVPPQFNRRHDYAILLDIAKAMGIFPGEDKEGWAIINSILGMKGLSIDQLKGLPDQIKIYENTPYEDVYQKCLKHEDGKIHCYPPEFEEAGLFDRCAEIFDELENEGENALKMISMRTPYMHNTWFANVKKFRRGAQSVNPLHMSLADAEALSLTDGEHVRVFNDYGEIETMIRIDEGLRQGAVAMSHGYGKGRSAMRVAESNPGANPNQLVPSTMDTIEPLSNMSWIGAYPVEVEKLVDA